MTKICPQCQKEYNDEAGFCSQCGARLVAKPAPVNPVLNLGDANAISGGISINQSKTVQHHDVYYQTVQERAKSEKELEQEKYIQYRDEVAKRMRNGIISSNLEREQLNTLRYSLGIDPERAAKIEEAVKNEQKARASGGELKMLGKIALDNAMKAVQGNLPNAADHIKRLAPVCRDTTNEQVHYYYYMLLAAFGPQQCVEAYEQRTVDSYWQSFWTSLAYRKLEKEDEFGALLVDLSKIWKDYPEANAIIGYCVGLWLSSHGNLKDCRDNITAYLNSCDTEPSELLNDLFHTLLHRVGMEDNDDSRFAFYEERFLSAGPKRSQECEAELKEALTAYHHADFETALRIWRKWAAKGETEAMHQIGSCYYWGLGVKEDEDTALEWYQKAADQGDAEAMYYLGNLYVDDGNDNDDKALRWFKKAAELGHADAMGKIGKLYDADEHFIEDNYREAIQWYRKALQGGCQDDYYLKFDKPGFEKEKKEIFDWCLKAADSGNVPAMYQLGAYYLLSKHDYDTALKWYRKAADLGDDKSMYDIGELYHDFMKPNDVKEAVKWYLKAAELGHVDAMGMLGEIYYDAFAASESHSDEGEALKWNSLAAKFHYGDADEYCYAILHRIPFMLAWHFIEAEKGDAEEQNKVGFWYYEGKNVAQDYNEAAKWYRLSAEQGYSVGQFHLGLCYEYGRGVTQNYNEAARLYRLSAEQGYGGGQYRLALCYEAGKGVPKSESEAYNWFKKAADQGNEASKAILDTRYRTFQRNAQSNSSTSTSNLKNTDADTQYQEGEKYFYGRGVTKSFEEAIKWYRMAAEKGHAAAQNALGYMYKNGLGVETDYFEAVKWLMLAAKQGHAGAMGWLGSLYESGQGVIKNLEKAEYWYRQAIDKGNAYAQRRLEMMNRK